MKKTLEKKTSIYLETNLEQKIEATAKYYTQKFGLKDEELKNDLISIGKIEYFDSKSCDFEKEINKIKKSMLKHIMNERIQTEHLPSLLGAIEKYKSELVYFSSVFITLPKTEQLMLVDILKENQNLLNLASTNEFKEKRDYYIEDLMLVAHNNESEIEDEFYKPKSQNSKCIVKCKKAYM